MVAQRNSDGGAWASRAGDRVGQRRCVGAPLAVRLLGVGRAFRGDPNPGFAGEKWPEMTVAVDGGGRQTARRRMADGTRSGTNLKTEEKTHSFSLSFY